MLAKTTMVGIALLLLATGCGKKTEAPEPTPKDTTAEESAAPVTDYIETGDYSLGIARQYRSDFKPVLDLGIERGLVWGARPGNTQLLAALDSYLKQCAGLV